MFDQVLVYVSWVFCIFQNAKNASFLNSSLKLSWFEQEKLCLVFSLKEKVITIRYLVAIHQALNYPFLSKVRESSQYFHCESTRLDFITVFTTNLSLSLASLAKESGISAFAMMRSTGFSLRSSFPCVRTDTAAPHLKYAHVKKVIVFIYEILLEIICTYLVSKGFQSSAN